MQAQGAFHFQRQGALQTDQLQGKALFGQRRGQQGADLLPQPVLPPGRTQPKDRPGPGQQRQEHEHQQARQDTAPENAPAHGRCAFRRGRARRPAVRDNRGSSGYAGHQKLCPMLI